jgi:hypothetical protein
MNLLLLISSFIFVMLVHFSIPVYACDCVIPSSVETEFSQSDAVFSGKVISIKESHSPGGYAKKEIIFEVYKTWKGLEESQVKITTGQGGGDCGYHFIPNGEYLVYGRNSDMYGKSQLGTGICDRTVDLEAAIDDLKILGNGKLPVKQVNIVSDDSLRKWINNNSEEQNWNSNIIVFVIFFIGIIGFVTWRNVKKT